MTMLRRANKALLSAATKSWPNRLDAQQIRSILDNVIGSIDSAGDLHKHTLASAVSIADVRLLWLMGACRDDLGFPALGPDGRLVCTWPTMNRGKKRRRDEISHQNKKEVSPEEIRRRLNLEIDALFSDSPQPAAKMAPSRLTKSHKFKHASDMLKKRQHLRSAYDYIRNIVGSSTAVLLQPKDLSNLLNVFDVAGYFNIDRMRIDNSVLSAETNDKGPLMLVKMQEYVKLMKKTSDAILRYHKLHKKRIVFVIRMSTEGGGHGAGPWYCKSHLWTFLLFLKYRMAAVVNSSLLLLDDAADEDDTKRVLGVENIKDICLVHLLDAIYSGVEAGNTAAWLEKKCYYGLIASPISAANEESGIVPRMSCGEATPPLNLVTQYYAAKCLHPGAFFLLPFKIPEEQSIGKYSVLLENMNPQFTPPYRRDILCRKPIYR